VAVVLAGILLGASGAQAKAPPDGVQVCGIDAVCTQLGWQDAEQLPMALWSDSYDGAAPAAASPFYVLHWHWSADEQHMAYYVPRAGKVWHVWPTGITEWSDLSSNTTVLHAASAALKPFPVPTIVSVTVGGRPARDPQSYLRLFGRGFLTWPVQEIRWIRVKIVGDAPSPWTDPSSEVFVSRHGRFLSVDGTILKIPLQLAQRIRHGASLRG
jgi:hypothetical protein